MRYERRRRSWHTGSQGYRPRLHSLSEQRQRRSGRPADAECPLEADPRTHSGMYEGAGFVKGAGPVSCGRLRVTAGVGARASDRCRLSGWVVARALRAFPSVHSPERDDQGWQARLPRHVFAAVVRMMGSRATAMSGSISSTTRSRRLGSCRSSNSRQGRVRVSRGCLDGLGEASDLAVA